MKLELENKKCKSAIVMLNGRLNLTTTDMIAVELDYIKRLLEKNFSRTVDYVSHKTKKDKDNPSYKDITETNLSDYDEVFIYNSSLNLFGGVFSMACLQTFKQLLDFKGTIYYILSDPRFPCQNFGELVRYKLQRNNGKLKVGGKIGETDLLTEADCDKFTNEIFPKIITAFNGFDYEMFYDLYVSSHRKLSVQASLPSEKRWCQFTFFEYFGYKLLQDAEIQKNYSYEAKKYDLVYYGINRRNERNKIIADLYSPESLKKLFIGFDGVELSNTDRIERVERCDLFKTIASNSLATVVIGDTFHNNNCITFRFYEAMLLDTVALIYDDFDKDRKLIKDKTLQDFIFVKTKEDVEDRIKKLRENQELYNNIVELERKEVKRLFENYKAI